MDELGHSLLDVLKKRTTSTFFGTYIFFWVSLHWQGVYTTLFTSQDLIYKKYGVLKNEYVNVYFFGIHNWGDFFFSAFTPLLLTFLFIWPIPKYVLILLYQIEQEHKTERLRVKHTEEIKRQEFKIEKIESEAQRVAAETVLSVERKKAEEINPRKAWEEEYKEFQKDPAFQQFSALINAYYEHSGHAKYYYNESKSMWTDPHVPSGILAIADSNGLISIDNKTNTFELTDKGRYFVKRFPSGR
jgi:hypothetical protein